MHPTGWKNGKLGWRSGWVGGGGGVLVGALEVGGDRFFEWRHQTACRSRHPGPLGYCSSGMAGRRRRRAIAGVCYRRPRSVQPAARRGQVLSSLRIRLPAVQPRRTCPSRSPEARAGPSCSSAATRLLLARSQTSHRRRPRRRRHSSRPHRPSAGSSTGVMTRKAVRARRRPQPGNPHSGNPSSGRCCLRQAVLLLKM